MQLGSTKSAPQCAEVAARLARPHYRRHQRFDRRRARFLWWFQSIYLEETRWNISKPWIFATFSFRSITYFLVGSESWKPEWLKNAKECPNARTEVDQMGFQTKINSFRGCLLCIKNTFSFRSITYFLVGSESWKTWMTEKRKRNVRMLEQRWIKWDSKPRSIPLEAEVLFHRNYSWWGSVIRPFAFQQYFRELFPSIQESLKVQMFNYPITTWIISLHQPQSLFRVNF